MTFCCWHCTSWYTWESLQCAPCISNKPDLLCLPDKPPCNRGPVPCHIPMVLQHLSEMSNVLVATMQLLLLYISRAICTLTFCSQSYFTQSHILLTVVFCSQSHFALTVLFCSQSHFAHIHILLTVTFCSQSQFAHSCVFF